MGCPRERGREMRWRRSNLRRIAKKRLKMCNKLNWSLGPLSTNRIQHKIEMFEYGIHGFVFSIFARCSVMVMPILLLFSLMLLFILSHVKHFIRRKFKMIFRTEKWRMTGAIALGLAKRGIKGREGIQRHSKVQKKKYYLI